MTASDRIRTHSKEKGGVQKDLLVKNTVDSAEIDIDSTIGERRDFEIRQARGVRQTVQSGNGFSEATLNFFEEEDVFRRMR